MTVLKHEALMNVPSQGRVVYLITTVQLVHRPFRKIVSALEKLGHIYVPRIGICSFSATHAELHSKIKD